MKSWKWITAAAGLSTALPAALMVWKPSIVTGIVLTVWSTAVTAGAIIYLLREDEKRRRREIQSLEQSAIRTLNHHRHDWMNELQILYGYIQLGKHDKTAQCVERIKERMVLDSKISKLGIPSLVFYLHSYRTYNNNLQLDIDIDDAVQLDGKLDVKMEDNLMSVIRQVISAYQFSGRSSWGESRELKLKMSDNGQALQLRFRGEGTFNDHLMLKQQIDLAVQGTVIQVEQGHPEEAEFLLSLPYAT